ncbi:DUF3365 domain-containing protein [Allomuricauda sp.]|uniref:Tll0287-like domain-containing protein n=1 Tax=Flagellimonas alginolytica TaxID=3177515 RepID=UPI0025ED0A3B|nr:DUF3365 domain-containing protein [Allomuricauda sp.]
MKNLFVFITLIIGIASCKKGPKTTDVDPGPVAQAEVFSPEDAQKLMETKCYLCHNPSAPEKGSRIGPPMVAIKAHYLTAHKNKDAFIKSIMQFVNSPTEENTLMRGAVRRFGVMPAQQFPETEVKKIAEYMFDYQIEEPDWFKEHWLARHNDSLYNKGKRLAPIKAKPTQKELGMQYALGTKKVLGQNLMGTIQNKGVEEAVVFCNERAYPLTDSMSTHFNARIRRVSDKPRNPNNRANAIELEHIDTFKGKVASGDSVEPILREENGKVYFYYPIVTNTMCLNCHGTPNKDILPKVYRNLLELYPKDMAVGYGPDEVRGLWSIVFDAPKNTD